MALKTCDHVDQIQIVADKDNVRGCEECLRIGSTWVHLRMCLTCGHVGCCDSSLHKHARKHFQQSGHPIIQSVERGEMWSWCHVDEIYLTDPPPPIS